MVKEDVIINPEGTLIGRAVRLDQRFSGTLFRTLIVFCWVAAVVALFVVVRTAVGLDSSSLDLDLPLTEAEREFSGRDYLGLAYIILGSFLIYLPMRAFYFEKVRYPREESLASVKARLEGGERANLFSCFSFELAKVTQPYFRDGKMPNTKHLAATLLTSKDMNFVLTRMGLSPDTLRTVFDKFQEAATTEQVMRQALEIAIVEGHHQIEVGDVFIALCQYEPFFQSVLEDTKLEVSDIAHIVYWQTSLIRKSLEGRRFLDPGRFRMTGGIGKDWAFGYTPILRQYGHDMTDAIQRYGLNFEVVGREKEIREIQEALLRRSGGNVILVGEAGIGKRTTVKGLANKMATGEIDEGLAFKHLIEVDINLLLSGYGGLGDAANRLTRLFNEALQAGNCILFIDNFESLLSTEGAGSINAIDVLLPFLESPGIHIIGTTDVASYNQFIRTNTALSERLTRVSVEEANTAETIRILEDTVPMIEHRTGSLISYEAIKETVKVANKYIMDVPNPEKSINVLDGATAHATSERGKTIVLPKDVLSYISIKHDIPATEVEDDEKQKLLHLEEEMHRNVVGQDEAIKAIAGALRRVRAGVTDSKKPIGSFLFLGPTGVGKTETAKSLARAYFGDADRMIRFDMSEYQNKEDIYRLIGSNVGQDVQGLLATAVREKPFSLLLFDEIEKAHPDILDLFLQILDEGHMTDGMGRKVAFSHTIIIATSNAGANLIRESIQGGVEYNKTKLALLDYLQRENIYRPEFINRFTQVVAFAPLSLQEIAQVAALMLAKLQDTVYANRGIKVVVTTEAAAMLAQLGYDPQMGARPMARIIQEKVENFLATKILAGELNKGDSVTISPADLS